LSVDTYIRKVYAFLKYLKKFHNEIQIQNIITNTTISIENSNTYSNTNSNGNSSNDIIEKK